MNILSIDIGGTKSKAIYYNSEKVILKSLLLDTCHVGQVSEKEAIMRLNQFYALIDAPTSVIIGYAGYGINKTYRKKIEKICRNVFKDVPYHIVSDAEMALYACLKGNDGVVASVGTGSIFLSKQNGMIKRLGGYGSLLSDEGSGYWIGQQLLSTFLKMADCRLEKTHLYDAIMQHYELNCPFEIVQLLQKEPRQLIACACKIAFEYYKQDVFAKKIINDAADQIIQNVQVLLTDFKKCVKVYGIGSLCQNDIFQNLLQTKSSHWCFQQGEVCEGGYYILNELLINKAKS